MDLKAKDYFRITVNEQIDTRSLMSLTSLYQPLIGVNAVMVYCTLHCEAINQKLAENHERLCMLTGLSIMEIEAARFKLEEYLLMKTYVKSDENRVNYVYVLVPPLNLTVFLNHEVFGRLYAKTVGMKQFEITKNKLTRGSVNIAGYQEVTAFFKNQLLQTWNEKNEEQFTSLKPEETSTAGEFDFPIRFNYEEFLSGLSNLMFPLEARTADNLRLIGELATLYGIDPIKMQELVSRSSSYETKSLNANDLRMKARSTQTTVQVTDNPYELPPSQFLQNKQKGIVPTLTDKKLLEYLVQELKLKPDVVNVLIEYILNINDMRLNRSFVEKIASTWVRLSIHTVEDALRLVASQKQTTRFVAKQREDVLPKVYKQQVDKDILVDELSAEQIEQLRQRLKKMEG